jgi:hypothetical protein
LFAAVDAYMKLQRDNGGDVHAGRKLGTPPYMPHDAINPVAEDQCHRYQLHVGGTYGEAAWTFA